MADTWTALGLLVVTLFGMLVFLGIRMDRHYDKLNRRIDSMSAKMASRIDSVATRLDSLSTPRRNP